MARGELGSIRWAVLLATLLLLPSTQAQAQSRKQPHQAEPNQAPAVEAVPEQASVQAQLFAFLEPLAALRALQRGPGQGNFQTPLVLVLGTETRTTKHLCQVFTQPGPRHCTLPNPEPARPSEEPPPRCVVCDESAKRDSQLTYDERLLGKEALERLFELCTTQGYFGRWSELASLVADTIDTWLGASDARRRAVALTLKTPDSGDPRAALNKLVGSALQASALSLGPEDLTTEGGLKASVKLAESSVSNARVAWQDTFAKWAKCRADALNRGALAVSQLDDDDTCKRAGGSSPHSAWRPWLDWQRQRDGYRTCLESNRPLHPSIARYQSEPCDQGIPVARTGSP